MNHLASSIKEKHQHLMGQVIENSNQMAAKITKLEEELVEEKQKNANLMRDFEYNFNLLEGRDQELERYDKEVKRLNQLVHDQ